MSVRNSRENKKRRRVAKALRPSLPAYINLIEYVKDRTRCTNGTARQVLLQGVLRIDSHPIGYKWQKYNGRDVKVIDPLLPAEYRDKIVISKPEEAGEWS